MSNKHTPGPWMPESDISSDGTDLLIMSNGLAVVCDLRTRDATVLRPPDNETEANAKLIAAAPELLAACQRMLPWIGKLIADGAHLNSVAPNDAIGAMQQADSAITKATIK